MLRIDFPAMLGLVAPSQNSLRELSSLRSDNRDESEVDARCARGHKPCASRRLTRMPWPARTRLCRTRRGSRNGFTHRSGALDGSASRQAVFGRGDLCGDEQRRPGVGACAARASSS